MQWALDNWLILLLGGGMVAMHMFGHGKHGKSGGSAKSGKADPSSKGENSGEQS